MKADYKNMSHEERMNAAQTRNMRRAIVPPIFFCALIAVVILASVFGYRRNQREGKEEVSTYSTVVDYLVVSIGCNIYENTDEVDQSYGDYFYLGADFYEVRVDTTVDLFGHIGTVVFDGESKVDSMVWTCDDDSVTTREATEIADELTTAYGPYELNGDGTAFWYADENGTLGENTDVAWISCGLNGDGVLMIQAEAQEQV